MNPVPVFSSPGAGPPQEIWPLAATYHLTTSPLSVRLLPLWSVKVPSQGPSALAKLRTNWKSFVSGGWKVSVPEKWQDPEKTSASRLSLLADASGVTAMKAERRQSGMSKRNRLLLLSKSGIASSLFD